MNIDSVMTYVLRGGNIRLKYRHGPLPFLAISMIILIDANGIEIFPLHDVHFY